MKTRVITGILASVILIIIMRLPIIAMGLTIFIVSVLALHEFYQGVQNLGLHPVRTAGFIFCVIVSMPLLLEAFSTGNASLSKIAQALFQRDMIYLYIFLITLSMLLLLVFRMNSFTLKDIAITLLGIVYVPFLLNFIFRVRLLNEGFALAWLVFIGAFSTDCFAYFIGKAFGKTKLLPEISPNKTVAGAIGGIIGSILCTVLFGVFYVNGYAGLQIPVVHYILMGLICGTFSQLGDWVASAIKRSVRIKDFGHILPGHGGMLDRADSLLFVAPAIYLYLRFLGM